MAPTGAPALANYGGGDETKLGRKNPVARTLNHVVPDAVQREAVHR